MKKNWKDVPLWIVNWVTIISGVVAVLTPIIGLVISFFTKFNITIWYIIAIVILALFLIILFIKMRKYAIIENKRMKIVSCKYQHFLYNSKNMFFDTMHSHKTNSLNINGLTKSYKLILSNMLDDLCDIMNSYTDKKIEACIKLISYPEDEEIIDKNSATLVTFCRSNNSDDTRNNYEKQLKKEIPINENTDFLYIIDDNNNKNYFYKGDLEKYDEELIKTGSKYRNTNAYWRNSYKATIVVPIQIEFEKLYHQKEKNAYHIIGFLCVDSLSKDAFTDKQEKYNVDILRSFSDTIYVLLSQYRHYLKKLSVPTD